MKRYAFTYQLTYIKTFIAMNNFDKLFTTNKTIHSYSQVISVQQEKMEYIFSLNLFLYAPAVV